MRPVTPPTRVNPTCCPYTRARGFLKLCVSADRRPPLATLGSADPDGADVVAAAPSNMVRVYELRGHPATESPLQKPGRGLNLVHFARFSANEVGAKLNLSRNSARAGKIYVGASV
jgi:hypothetical protein